MLKLVEELLLLCSRLNPTDEDYRKIRRLLTDKASPPDFQHLVSLSQKNGVAPLVYRVLQGIDEVPEQILSTLQSGYYALLAWNAAKLAGTLDILKLLGENRIDVIPLKGAIASEILFGDLGLYIGSDIDILIRQADLEKTKKVLLESGYSSCSYHESEMREAHYHISMNYEKHVVEVHWNLVIARYFSVTADFWWDDSFTVPFEGIEMRCLSPERYLLYLVFRLFSHQFHPLKFLVLASEHIKANNERIDWNKLISYADKYRMRRLLLFSCHLLNDLLGTNIGGLSRHNRIMGYDMLKGKVLQGLFSSPARPYIRKIYYLCLLDSVSQISRGIIGRFLPSKAELGLRYNIPKDSPMIYLYYLLNILLLPKMIFRKGSAP